MSESTDMVTEVYGHILDEDRRKNAELMENAFYNKVLFCKLNDAPVVTLNDAVTV